MSSYDCDYGSEPERCDCEHDDDTGKMIFMCKWCTPYVPLSNKNTITTTIETTETTKTTKIYSYINMCNSTDDMSLKISTIRDMFEYIITCHEFVAKNPKFRKTILDKIKEFELDERCNSIKDILEKTHNFIIDLSSRDDYISLEN